MIRVITKVDNEAFSSRVVRDGDNVIVVGEDTEVYYNEGETLPTEGIPFGTFAFNVDTFEVAVFNGTAWVVKHADGTLEKVERVRITEIFASQFENDTTIVTADYPDVITIGDWAFTNCEALTMANFPVAETVGNNAFSQCTALTNANFPNVKTVGNYAFVSCPFKTANFQQLTSFGNNAFQGSALLAADFPLVESVSGYSFQNCTNLQSANFPLAVSVGSSAFEDCTNLQVIDLPEVESIANYAFSGCNNLKAVVLRGETVCANSGSFTFIRTPFEDGTGYFYVRRALVEEYKVAEKWDKYAAQFRALEDYTVDGTITGALDWNKINATA